MADQITTHKTPTGLWEISGRTWRKTFEDMCLCIAWGDPAHPDIADHAVAVAGRQEDGVIDVCDGLNGAFGEIVGAAVNFKDLYQITRGYVEPEPAGHTLQARRTDGLTGYMPAPDQLSTKRPRYLHNSDHWPHFVSRSHVLSLGNMPDGKIKDVESLITRMEELAAASRVRFARRKWPALFEALGRNRARMSQKAVVRVAAYAVDRLYREQTAGLQQKEEPVYGNLRRGSKK